MTNVRRRSLSFEVDLGGVRVMKAQHCSNLIEPQDSVESFPHDLDPATPIDDSQSSSSADEFDRRVPTDQMVCDDEATYERDEGAVQEEQVPSDDESRSQVLSNELTAEYETYVITD